MGARVGRALGVDAEHEEPDETVESNRRECGRVEGTTVEKDSA